MAPYNNNIPQPADQLDNSQGDFLANFMTLQTYFSVDHVPLSTIAVPQVNQGKHNQLTLPAPAPDTFPLPNEAAIESVISNYTALVEIGYQNTILVTPPNQLMTARQFPQPRFPGWATLGGSGLLIKWGQVTSAGFTIVGLPDDGGRTIPQFINPPYSIILSPISQPGQNDDIWIRMGAVISVTTFSCYASARTTVGVNPNVTFFYLAIGNY